MGSAVSSSFERSSRVRAAQTALPGAGVGGCLPRSICGSASRSQPRRAQSPPAPAQAAKAPDKLVIEADELVYDKDKNTVSAVGSVQLFYQGRVLQADRVVYNRATKRVYAEGHAKMTDEHGDVVYGSRFELSDNFRDGFIDSVQVLTSDKTRFTSPRVERSNGDVTVLRKGAYTACEPCKDHPERPPFWQVRAARIIENQETHTVYFEDAQMLVWGVPVFYMPYFSSPDSTVNKQTGLLAPQFVSGARSRLRPQPALFHQSRAELRSDPHSDLPFEAGVARRGRLAPAAVERPVQHPHDRDRRAAAERSLPPYPYGAGRPAAARARSRPRATSFSTRTGSSAGTRPGCRTSSSPTTTSFRASISAITTSRTSFRRSICAARPITASSTSAPTTSKARRPTTTTARCRSRRRCSTTIASSPFRPTAPTASAAKRRSTSTSPTSISTNAAFQSTGLQTFDNAYHLYNVCETVVGGKYVNTYYPGACMLRGIAGDYTRASGQVSWQRSYIDTIGEVWKPFAFARLDGEATAAQRNRLDHLRERDRIEHGRQLEPGGLFLRRDQGAFARGMAGVGLEYRYPFTIELLVGHADDHADRPVDRPAERDHSRHPAERGRPEPRLRRDEPVRLEQVLRIRPDRGRHPAQLRPPVHRRLRQRRPRQRRRRAVDPGRRPEFLHALRRRQYRAGFRPRQDNSRTSSPARRSSRLRPRFRSSASSSSTARLSSSIASTPSPRRRSPA